MKLLVKSALAGLVFNANTSFLLLVASSTDPRAVQARCDATLGSFSCLHFLTRTLQKEYNQLKEQHGQRGVGSGGGGSQQWESDQPDEADLLAEAKLLRQHKGRLEARMHILEEHNKQLESQLHRLRQLLHQVTHQW